MGPGKILEELVARYPVLSACRNSIWDAYAEMCHAFENGGKLLIAGNGGSAADAEHIVGELMKGFVKTRELPQKEQEAIMDAGGELGAVLSRSLQQSLPAIALTGHTALTTAYMNDVDGMLGFAQQVYGYGKPGDIFLGITTSGNSKNVLNATVVAKAKGMKAVALTGRYGGKIKDMADISIIVPETETYKIQELHLPVYHALCLMLEENFFG